MLIFFSLQEYWIWVLLHPSWKEMKTSYLNNTLCLPSTHKINRRRTRTILFLVYYRCPNIRYWKVLLNYFVLLHFPCGGVLEYLHSSPVSRRRRRKKPSIWGYIWVTLSLGDLILQFLDWTQGWRPWSVKKLLLRNPKKWKPHGLRINRAEYSKEGYDLKRRLFCKWWWWWWWW
jgi:hypothetical protein